MPWRLTVRPMSALFHDPWSSTRSAGRSVPPRPDARPQECPSAIPLPLSQNDKRRHEQNQRQQGGSVELSRAPQALKTEYSSSVESSSPHVFAELGHDRRSTLQCRLIRCRLFSTVDSVSSSPGSVASTFFICLLSDRQIKDTATPSRRTNKPVMGPAPSMTWLTLRS